MVQKKKGSVKKKTNVKKNTAPKKQTPEPKNKKVTTKPKIEKKKQNVQKKDVLLISILSALLVVIIVLLFALPSTTIEDADEKIDENGIDDDLDDDPGLDDDVEYTEEEIYEILEDLQYRLNQQIIQEQTDIFEGWYDELNLDQEEMEICIARNNYSEDIVFEESDILNKIMADMTLAREVLGFQGTPGIMVNGYKMDGFVEYDVLKKRIDAALEDIDNDLPLVDFSTTEQDGYDYDAEQDPVLHIIYNQEHDFTEDELENIIESTLMSDYASFFIKFFDTIETNHVDFFDAPEHITNLFETYNIHHLPFFFVEGDVSKLEFTEEEQEMFYGFFQEIPNGGYTISLKTTYLTDYTVLDHEDDYVIGDENAQVTVYLFSDYDCGGSQKIQEELVPKIKEDYFDDGLVNIVIKDFVVYEAQSLFPAVFVRCAEEQNKYYETHKKLFENREQFGMMFVEGIMEQYMDELEELQRHYDKLYQ